MERQSYKIPIDPNNDKQAKNRFKKLTLLINTRSQTQVP